MKPTVNHARSLCRLCAALILTALFVSGCARREDTAETGAETQGPQNSGAAEPERRTSSETAETGSAEVPTGPPGLLVSVDELRERLYDNKTLRVLDARSRSAYAEAHIPGALHVDVGAWKAQSLKEGGRGLQDAEFWLKTVGGLGIDSLTNVVVYSTQPTNATRIWWTLKYLGVEHAGVLDGGWPAWKRADGPTSGDMPEVEAVEFQPDFQKDRLAQLGQVRKSIEAEEDVVVDARSEGEYSGTVQIPDSKSGHIPGARHLEWKELLTGDGRFKSADELKAIFKEHGLAKENTVITHCQTGGRASLNAFALELAGYDKVQNYYCGWSEWGTSEETPVKDSQQPSSQPPDSPGKATESDDGE